MECDLVEFLEIGILKAQSGAGMGALEGLTELALVTPQPQHEGFSEAAFNILWDLPRDSLSILQCHLMRPAYRYSTSSGQALSEKQWMHSRIRTFQQLDVFASLSGALGSALLAVFSREPEMISKVTIPKSRIFGSIRAGGEVRIIRSAVAVSYVISRNSDSKALSIFDAPDSFYSALQTRMEELVGRASGKVSKSKVIHQMGLKMYMRLVMEMLIGAVGSYSVYCAPAIETMKTIGRDNWIYVRFGDVIFAHQVLKKSKNIRKE